MSSQPPLSIPSLTQETAWVHRLARQLVRDEHLAADVAQDALVVGLGGARPDDPAVTPRGWLAGIARRLAQQSVRRRREREVRELLAASARVEDPEQRAAERLRVHGILTHAIAGLPEPYRTAVTLRFFEGLSPRVIARQLGHTPEAVRQHVHRGLGMLRVQLDREFGDRRAWLVMFAGLGLARPFVGLPFTMTGATLAVALVVLLAVAVVVALTVLRPRHANESAPVPAPEDPAAHHATNDMVAATAAAPAPWQDPAKVAAEVDRYLQPLVQSGAFAGCVLLARGGNVIVQKAYGLADREAGTANTLDTRFKLMSTSKAITAVAVMRLVQAGKLALTDRVGAHVKPWPEAWRDVTVHDLLDHTSGIPNLEVEWSALVRGTERRRFATWPAFAERLAAREVWREQPVHRYSNFNFELAGVVAEAASGQRLRHLVAEQVCGPAGMQATGFDDGTRAASLAVGYFFGAVAPRVSTQDMSGIQAAGGLWSTVGDLYRLDRSLRGDDLLSAKLRADMVTPRAQSPAYACGWQVSPVRGHRCWHHSGGANGYVADFLRFPDDDACVVVLSNHAFAPIMRISSDLTAVLFGDEHKVPVSLSREERAGAAGCFRDEGGSHRLLVVAAGEHVVSFELWGAQERCGARLLLPLGEGRFLPAFGDGEYTIDAAGAKTPSGALARCDTGSARWRELVGPLRMQTAIGESAVVVERDGRLVLCIAGGWPAECTIVPLGDDIALVMPSEDFGTVIRRDGDTLRWTRADGKAVTFTRGK